MLEDLGDKGTVRLRELQVMRNRGARRAGPGHSLHLFPAPQAAQSGIACSVLPRVSETSVG